jgi:hypothetical protein
MKSSTAPVSKKPTTKAKDGIRTRSRLETDIKTKTVTRAVPVSKKTKAVSKVAQTRVSSSRTGIRTQVGTQKKRPLSGVGRSTKRYGKRVLKGMLLSSTFHVVFKVVAGFALSGAIFYGSYALMGKSLAHDVVVSKSEIVSRIAKLTPVPEEAPDAVVRVQDPETLKKQNIFYDRVKEGDYIVMYPKVAIIYDLRNNEIVAVKKTESR